MVITRMGKKRLIQQSSNGIVTGDSSESDGSQNQDKPQNPTRQCTHAAKSIDQNTVKKNLKLEDIDNNNFCQQCTKLGQEIKGDDVYICLRCGVKTCSKEHSKEHNAVPHSDPHALSLNLSDRTVWCHDCAEEITVCSNKKLDFCVNSIESMHKKHLKGRMNNKSMPKIEPIVEESPEENKLQAVPISPPKNKNLVGVKGLWNLGNTCFFNSVLQCLAQTPNLIETLREMQANKEVSIELNNGRVLNGSLEKQDNFAEELAETLSNIKGPGQAVSPQKVLQSLRKKVSQFRGNDQHDSHELLRHLLDTVRCSDLKRYRKIMLNELGLNGMDNEKVDAGKQKELKQLDREVTDKVMLVPDQVFRGFLVSRLECQECHHSSECVESFLDLSLPVTSEKPHPPTNRRKGFSSTNEEKAGTSQMSKHQLKKERRLERKKNRGKHGYQNKKNEFGQGEAVPSISEKGESDADGDDGDVDSEESDKKAETGFENGPKEELLCVGVPIPPDQLSRLNKLKSESPHRTEFSPRGSFDGADRPVIPLTEEGVPDISKLSIYDSSSPQLKTFVRDSETISKEDPSWLSNLHDLPGWYSLLSNENISTPNSKAFEGTNESADGKSEKVEKEEEISSDDKTVVGENSAEVNEVQESRLSNHQVSPSEASSTWDENSASAGPAPFESHQEDGNINDEAVNSDDEHPIGNIFEEADTSECTVQSCLGQFTGIELMTGSNKVGCETCTERANKGKKDGKTIYTMSTKQLLISEAPPVLILHIKRFQVQMSSFRKLSMHVAFPLELDISPFCKVETAKKSPKRLLYSLYGIVEHSGNFSGGHYVAYVKVENTWFCISDCYVNEVKESRVLQAQAYLLFYKSS